MKKFKAILFGILIFLIAEAIQIVTSGVMVIVYGMVIVFKVIKEQGSEILSDMDSYMEAIQGAMSGDIVYLITAIGISACGIVFYFWYKKEIKGEARGKLHNLINVKHIFLFVMLGIGCQFFISGVLSIVQQFFTELFSKYAQQLETLTDGNDFVVLVLLVIIAPITEELIFRGMILHKANKEMTFWAANLFQAVMFGIYHLNIIQGIYAALLGILLGLVYRKFRTIFAPIFLHMIVNASSYLIMFVPDKTLSIYIITGGGAILIATALYFIKTSRVVICEDNVMVGPEVQNPGSSADSF